MIDKKKKSVVAVVLGIELVVTILGILRTSFSSVGDVLDSFACFTNFWACSSDDVLKRSQGNKLEKVQESFKHPF